MRSVGVGAGCLHTTIQVRQHASEHDCWTVLRGRVYDLTSYLPFHPGGRAELMRGAGDDCTALFKEVCA